jgi:hypothetical protein
MSTTPALRAHTTNPTLFSRPVIQIPSTERVGNLMVLLATSASLLVSLWALFTTDIIHINTLAGKAEFGMFKSCVTTSFGWMACSPFPPQDGHCRVGLETDLQHLNFCQVWLSSRYLLISSVAVGLLSWFGSAVVLALYLIANHRNGYDPAPYFSLGATILQAGSLYSMCTLS